VCDFFEESGLLFAVHHTLLLIKIHLSFVRKAEGRKAED
jgi:hypothetical protein